MHRLATTGVSTSVIWRHRMTPNGDLTLAGQMASIVDFMPDDEKDNVRVTLRLSAAQVNMLDHINDYLGLGDRVDVVRYLMNRGAETIRFQQTVREQADVIQQFTRVLSEDFEKLASSMDQAQKDKDQTILPFNAPEQTEKKGKATTRKSSGPSSTGTKSQK